MNAWTWVPYENAFCANGSTTGIGVNPTTSSKNLVIYFEGGGACWSALTCYTLMTASNLSGYGPTEFAADEKSLLDTSIFDRTDMKNPFKDASFVYVPYCTGDVHAGTNATQVYNGMKTMHVGGTNFQHFLPDIEATFPGATHVTVSGSSAGGFGAAFNFWRVHKAFASARVYLLDDAGPPLPAPYLTTSLAQLWSTAWGLDANLPPDCPDCQTNFTALFDYYAKNYPTSRVALLSYLNDSVISEFFMISQAQMAMGLQALATTEFDPRPEAKYYYVTGSTHTLLGNPYGIMQNGVVLMDWLTQFNNDDPTWASVKP
jgi:hypothetical protein